MKVAFILPSLVNKGPVIAVYNLVKYLKRSVSVIDVYYFDDVRTPLNFECDTYQIKKSEVINFNKYDIIHSHTLRADLYLYKFRKKIFKPKIISTIHQDTFQSFKIKFNFIASIFLTFYWLYIYRKFDGIVSISNHLEKKYSLFLPNKITTIHNGCNIGSIEINELIYSKIQQIKERGFKILCSYATITKGKGLSQVISCLTELDDFVYIIIGEGSYLEHLKKLVNKLMLSERVFFFPYVPFPYSYLKYIDLYMMPSYHEGFGLAMVEAAFEKKSIVCSNIPSFRELFSEMEVSFFELDNVQSLKIAINKAYFEREKRGNMAYLKAISNYTSELMADNHFKYYKNIIK